MEDFERIRAAHWRHKNGLEHRCLVALIQAPEVLEEAGTALVPEDFLTPAYATLAAVLLRAPGSDVLELARTSLAGRPYLPSMDGFDWAHEARESVSELVRRRDRWKRG
jgi:hypothetical protein